VCDETSADINAGFSAKYCIAGNNRDFCLSVCKSGIGTVEFLERTGTRISFESMFRNGDPVGESSQRRDPVEASGIFH